ncbi:MAG: hypothetical protein ACFB15_07875 [Cyclobacteriaceae bacterium]
MEDQIDKWISRIQQSKRLPDSQIKAFNFGIIETEGGCSVYLIGSREYHGLDDDWACKEDCVPKEKYLYLSKEYDNLECQEVEKVMMCTLSNYLNNKKFENSFLSQATAITTGFDGGELIRIK